MNKIQIIENPKGTYSSEFGLETTEACGGKKQFTWIPFYKELANKLLTFKNNRKELVAIAYETGYANYLKASDGSKVSDIDPFTFFGIFNRKLRTENRIKIAAFFKEKFAIEANVPTDFDGIPVVNNMKASFCWSNKIDTATQPLWDLFEAAITGNRENLQKMFDVVRDQEGIRWNITMGLYWIRPNDYISLDSTNQKYLDKLGFEMFDQNNLDSAHYFTLLDAVQDKLKKMELKEKNIPEISYNAWTVSYTRKYWLVGCSFGGSNSQKERFVNEGIWEGGFDKDKSTDKAMLKLVDSFKEGDVLILKSTGTKGKGQNLPFMRVKTAGVISSPIEKRENEEGHVMCTCKVNYVNATDKDFEGSVYGSYRKTVHKADDGKINDVISYVDSILGNNNKNEMTDNKYKEYTGLLEASYNLVLTGAPGTGKTHMAKAIAKAMGCGKDEMEFVQFHPSYDYTDFVEGLRPIEDGTGNIGFERKDGVFKKFCQAAIQNIKDSQKSSVELDKEFSWREKLEMFVSDAIESETKFKTVNGAEFRITELHGNNIVAFNEQNAVTARVTINVADILELLTKEVTLKNVRDIRTYFNRKHATQADSYAFVIVKDVRKRKGEVNATSAETVERKNFVFIIDEINRGEVSKIFGELFYAIDPGYRGDTDVMVKTQYQNLIKEGEPFSEGFYIPKNVYIIGTMNDIDRSVESMDFAMRRRFTWKEVAPEDTQDMLDSLEQADKAKESMNRLNKCIKKTDGLGSAYQIGAAYFLKLKNNGGDFEALWNMNIEPLLREYLRGFRYVEETMSEFKDAYDGKQESQKVTDSEDFIDE